MRYTFMPIVVAAVILASCSAEEGDTPPIEDQASSSVSSQSSSVDEPGFSVSDGIPQGTVTVEGYADIEIVIEPFCEGSTCEEYDYVFFNITKSDSAEFEEFLTLYGGNAFASDSRIGLGCLIDEHIVYENDSDLYGRKEFILTEEDTSNILDATSDNPVTLTLTKLPLTGGAGAPACYSHFTTIE